MAELALIVVFATCTTNSSIPSTSITVSCSVNSFDVINVSWSPASGATSYEVWRYHRTGYYLYYKKIGTTSNTSWPDADVMKGHEYKYHINPCNAAGCAVDDPVMGGSPTAICHLPCTDDSQCSPNEPLCLTYQDTDCGGTPWTCTYWLGICTTDGCCAEVNFNSSGPVYRKTGPATCAAADRSHGCVDCWPSGHQCYEFYCDGMGNLVGGERLCSCLASCSAYVADRCFPDPFYNYSCADSCE